MATDRRGAWLLMAALVIAAGCHADPLQESRRHLEAGDRYVAAGKPAEALVEYRAAVQAAPKSSEAREKLADLALHTNDPKTAYREYVRAADLAPDNLAVQLKAATMLLAAGQFEDAKTRADGIISKDPKNVAAHLLRAHALIGLKDVDGAIAQVHEAIESNPNLGETYTNLGAIEMAQNKRDDAETSFLKAVELAPRSVQTQLALGNFYWLNGEWAKADQALTAALEADPRDLSANRAMGNFYLATNRFSDAEAPLQKAAALSHKPDDRLALSDYYVLTHRLPLAQEQLKVLLADPAAELEARTRLALLDYRTGRHDAAYAALNQILAAHPGNEKALLVKAQLLYLERRYPEAIDAANKAASSAAAAMLIAQSHMALHQPAEAVTAYREVLRLNPRATPARLALAKLELARGNAATSLSLAREVVSAAPSNPDARLTVARALLTSGDLAAAQEELAKLNSQYPKVPAVHAELGMLYGRQAKPAAARAEFMRALALEPTNTRALTGLVALDMQEHRVADVRQHAADLVKAHPTADNYTLAARFYGGIGDRAAAERMLRLAIEQDPNSMPAYLALGNLYVAMNRLTQAREQFQTISAHSEKPVAAMTMVAILLQAEGRTDEAKRQYEKALSVDPTAFVAANNLAWLLAQSGADLDRALQLARQAQAQQPSNASVCDTLGYVLLATNQVDAAIAQFEKSVAAEPSNPVYQYHLGKANANAGRLDDARKHLSAALKLSGSFDGAADARTLAEAVGPPRL